MEDLKNTQHKTVQKTGWDSLDNAMQGLEGLVIVGGRPGMGKSTLGMNIAEYAAFDEKKTALIFSLELPTSAVGERILTSQLGLQRSGIRFESWSDNDFSAACIFDTSRSGVITVCDEPRLSISEIKSIALQCKERFGDLGVIVIDYIQLLADYEGNLDTVRRKVLGNLYENLKLLSEELDCPVLALSQLSRRLENRSDRRPRLSDLNASRAAKRSADTIIFLYRDEFYHKEKKKGIAEVIIAKHRNADAKTVELSFQPQIMRFIEKSEMKNSRREE